MDLRWAVGRHGYDAWVKDNDRCGALRYIAAVSRCLDTTISSWSGDGGSVGMTILGIGGSLSAKKDHCYTTKDFLL